ncbi:MAG: adenylate/guanylate cyclase domain-containing protein [Rhodospirillaceae bacterium]|nr:adenylate/guanylate cyclase domain-containing protein [Rhodospirillaceae bacterium]
MSARRRTFSLLAALLAVLVPLVVVVVGSVIWQGYRNSRAAAMDAGNQLFQNLQTEVAVQQQSLFEPLRFLISTFADDPGIAMGEPNRYLQPFITVLARYPHVSGFRVGYATGELFEVIAFRATDPVVRAAAGAPETALYAAHAIVMADGNLRESWRFFDRDRAEVARREDPHVGYDPPTRPWYSAATATPGELVETAPYVFHVIREPGLSVAKAFSGDKPGVLSADVTLQQLSFTVGGLASENNEQLFLFLGNGKLLAHADLGTMIGPGPFDPQQAFDLPDVARLDNPVAAAMMDRFARQGPFSADTMVIEGVPFLAGIIRLGIEGDVKSPSPSHLALALPESNFTETFNAIARNAVAISLAILVLSIPVVVFVARRFSKPLEALALETERIAQLDLATPVAVASRIREIARLGDSLDRTKSALAQVAKFVPRTLVQDLVRSGTRMEVGGERRVLSVLFTDVKDFTTIAETLPAETLMAQMSEYFEAVVQVVLAQGGTVDKYVGDAVFAFWNAPLKQLDHELLACQAALAARDASNALNARWTAAGKPVWYTRLAVHAGDAVVGNVGSAERLDYTAVGDTINMGSRLEGLNKVYGTQVIASGAVVDKAKDRFLFRPLDTVVPKGAVHPVDIAELLGPADASREPEVAALCESWLKVMAAYRAREWKKAYAAVIAHAERFPNDGPGALFSQRISGFLSAPPPGDWDGATRFESK